MAIDPAVLVRQQRAMGEAPRPKRVDTVRMVRRSGPPLTDVKCSLGCGRFLAVTNRRGVCAHCATNKWKAMGRKDPRAGQPRGRREKTAFRRAWFSHGGGI